MKNKTQQLFDCIYQDTVIHFLLEKEGDVMVNATEMAKPFGKEPKDFLRLEGTKKFIAYQLKKNNIVADVPRYIEENIYYSNNKAGTFMTRKLSLKFAAWLDVALEDWVFDTIDNILYGKLKPLKESVTQEFSAAQNLEIALQNAMLGDSEEAKELAKAMLDYNEAKKLKNKASRNFNSQLKMSL